MRRRNRPDLLPLGFRTKLTSIFSFLLHALCEWHILEAEFGNRKPSTNISLEMSKLLETRKTAKIVQFASTLRFLAVFQENRGFSVFLAIGAVEMGVNPEIHPRPYVNGTFYKQNLVTANQATIFRWRCRNAGNQQNRENRD